jgi:transposase InsO family protein
LLTGEGLSLSVVGVEAKTERKALMSHPNARLTALGRLLLCERIELHGWRVCAAAAAAGVSRQTASKWLARWRREGRVGLSDRSSRPHRIALCVVGERLRRVVRLRVTRRLGPARIAWHLRLAPATVYRTLRRHRLHRLRLLDPHEPALRYCWPAAGDLVHLDTKKLGRIGPGGGKRFYPRNRELHNGIGWNVAHVAVDDATRLAYAEELPDERGGTAAAFLERALAFFADHGVEVRRLLTDNGSPYVSRAFREAAAAHGLRHLRTRPYRPQTNGKAEAFVKTLQNGWAYRRPYQATAERIAALPGFLCYYNGYRPHGGLDGDTPLGRLTASTTS